MAKVVTVMNMKGGVGKTTVCMHIGGLLARRNFGSGYKKVLLIDYDPQFNLSQAFLRTKRYFQIEKAGRTCLRILQDSATDLDPFKIQTPTNAQPPKLSDVVTEIYNRRGGGSLDLVPSTLNLMYIAIGTSTGDLSIVEARFKKFIEAARSKYDLIMIDCHPAGSLLTKTSLQNSDHVLIPVAPQAYAVRGVALMNTFIKASQIGGIGPTLHVVFNLIPRSGPASAEEKEIRGHKTYGPMCLARPLKRYKAFSVPQEGRGFVWGSGRPWSGEAFSSLLYLVNEFVDRLEI